MPTDESAARLLVETVARDGGWNMAYDEALLEAATSRGETILRIYRWSEPTLSLGYFQKTLPAGLSDELRSLPRVRRLSGGGAILHHHEWTYSCAVPRRHALAARPELLYEAAHRALITAFGRHGIAASLRGESNREPDREFLCFLRGDARDILVAGHKIVGSAQRRRRGAVLQHGSVLLRSSALTPDVPGLTDLVSGLGTEPLLAVQDFIAAFTPILFLSEPLRQTHPADMTFAQGVQKRIETARRGD